MTTTTAVEDVKLKILKELEPVALQNGFELVDIEITTQYGQQILRAYIDKDGGVTVDDCAHISGYFEDVLDVSDIVMGRYMFEVSSPGLNRPLRKTTHFEKALGKKIQVVTLEKIDGRKNFKGILQSVKDETLTLEIDNNEFLIPIHQVQKANVVHVFL